MPARRGPGSARLGVWPLRIRWQCWSKRSYQPNEYFGVRSAELFREWWHFEGVGLVARAAENLLYDVVIV